MIEGKHILITGGSGFLAKALVKRLLGEHPASILCFARDEGKLLEMQRQFGVQIMPGDVTNFHDVSKAMAGIDIVFHLAGFKHLPLAEIESQKAVETNVMGAVNILEASVHNGPEMIVATSTDKAYNPMNCYGMTKRLMEYMFAEYERINGGNTAYRVVRYGNVLGSTGSVIQVWNEAAQRSEPIKVTDPDMTRFFFSVDDAVQTIFDCMEQATDATPFVPTMKSVRMGDLADVFAELAGNRYARRPLIDVVGLRPGEKLHEGMADDAQSDAAERYSKEEITKMVLPLL